MPRRHYHTVARYGALVALLTRGLWQVHHRLLWKWLQVLVKIQRNSAVRDDFAVIIGSGRGRCEVRRSWQGLCSGLGRIRRLLYRGCSSGYVHWVCWNSGSGLDSVPGRPVFVVQSFLEAILEPSILLKNGIFVRFHSHNGMY